MGVQQEKTIMQMHPCMTDGEAVYVAVCTTNRYAAGLHSPQHRSTNNAAFIEAIIVLIFPRDVRMDQNDSDFSLRARLLVQRQT